MTVAHQYEHVERFGFTLTDERGHELISAWMVATNREKPIAIVRKGDVYLRNGPATYQRVRVYRMDD